jgi:hypothetical protein
VKNAGLFSTLFLDEVENALDSTDDAQGRLVTLSQSWQRRDASSTDGLWRSFIKSALGNLGFVVKDQPLARGLYGLFEDYSFQNCIALLYVVEPRADLNDESIGRFWPAKLITALRERKLNWGILTDGAEWRLYSTKSAKPYEDHVELDLGTALESSDEISYALFERFFHADSFVPRDRADYDSDKVAQLNALGLKARKQRRSEAASSGEESSGGEATTAGATEREAGIYLCRLDLDGEISESILEAYVKEPLLAQVDNVLRYICNGFIADTQRAGMAYTEEERREVFESSVKLLYRCLFLFYAEARGLLPSEDQHREIYTPHSINALCREARKFRWNERDDTAGYDLWQQLKGLVQAVNEGEPGYGVMGYNGGLFDDEEECFLGQHRLRNDFLWQALYDLAFVDPVGNEREDEYLIPYEDLEVRHLGEMYEAILEYKVRLADTDYLRRHTKNGWQTLPAATQKVQDGDIRIKSGDIFFGETALERKQSGSYYTPESLVRFLVGKAVIAPLRERWESSYRDRFAAFLEETRTGYDDATRRGALHSAQELVTQFVRREVLPYKVCDPAMGSGHFLVAAANGMADFVVELLAAIESLASFSSGKTGAANHWRRLITRHCLYGVDFNPLAVNLAKLALWLNCFARDHKLTFLDHHLRPGNSLIGLRDLAALRRIPARRKDTRGEREEADKAAEELPLRLDSALHEKLAEAASSIAAIAGLAEDDTDRQRDAFEQASRGLQRAFAPLADLHTAYLIDGGIRPADYVRLSNHFAAGKPEEVIWPDLQDVWQRVRHLRERHRFLHWPLEFPDVFGRGKEPGFSATVGNPPWDAIKPLTLEFYADFDPLFRTYEKQEAIRVANRLKEDPAIGQRWRDYEALVSEQKEYFTQPAVLPAVGTGDLNTYKLFANVFLVILKTGAEMAILVPSGIYTDEGCKALRSFLFAETKIESIYSFENRRPEVFPAVHNQFKFATVCTKKGGSTVAFRCAFMQHDPWRLPVIEQSAVEIGVEFVRKFSPDGLSLMEFSSAEAARIATKLYSSSPLLSERVSGTWNCQMNRELHMTDDSHLFHKEEVGFALYEGKMIQAFDHLCCPPTYWIDEKEARDFERRRLWIRAAKVGKQPVRLDLDEYRTGFRNVAASTNERAFLSTVLPPEVISPHTMVIVRRRAPLSADGTPVEMIGSAQAVFLTSLFNSFVCDYLIRMKIATHLDMHFVYSLPIPRLGNGDAKDAAYFWPIVTRALRLICTTKEYAVLWAEVFSRLPAASLAVLRTAPVAYGPAHERVLRERLAQSASALASTWTPACGLHDRTPERRDTGDRAQTRAELDALIAQLYGLTRDEFAYILDAFPVLRRKELACFGEYQSKRKALEEYDRWSGQKQLS